MISRLKNDVNMGIAWGYEGLALTNSIISFQSASFANMGQSLCPASLMIRIFSALPGSKLKRFWAWPWL
jgi:hypothetical protein